MYKLIFYTFSSAHGWYILKDTEIMPWYLGGKGKVENAFIGIPWQPQIPGLLEYSLFQLGYFIEELFQHLIVRERTSDYWEMNLHHFLTITLISGMIVQNFIRAGTIISFLHCLSDISTAFVRLASQTSYKNTTIVSFFICILSWIYLRNVCIPMATWELWVYLRYPEELAAY